MSPTGSVITVQRKSGPVLYIKARDRSGRQIKRRLGPLHNGRGKRPSASWTMKQATAELHSFLTDLGRAPDGPSAAMTLEAASLAWLHYIEHERERRPSTVGDYRSALSRHILPFFGAATPLSSIDTERVDEFRRHLLTIKSRRTAQKLLTIVHGLLKYAKRRKWIATNPAEDAERVAVRRRPEFAVLSPDEVHALARAAGGGLPSALFIVAAFTGLRMGELRALRWRDVDFAKRLVHVRRSMSRQEEGDPKSGKARSVPMVDDAARVLDELSRRPRFTGRDDRVFCGEQGGRLDEGDMRDWLYAALAAARIDRDRGTGKLFVFHDLRHTFGTLAVQAFPLSDVQAYMGHADIATTMIYVHHTPQHDAAERLTALVGQATGYQPGTELNTPSGPERALAAPEVQA